MLRLVSALVAFAGPALADGHDRPVRYEHVCSADGAALTLENGQRIYLGKSCDTFVPGHGTGNWWYAASGFWVSAPDFGMKFNGQDAPCPSLPYCQPPE
ncbi:hypothetical protein FIU97_13960 [Roseivivax sp. THAF40]|uniref:hypothetical protein n=1 Tax=unclassified Roseivivax TaxID=2639302 RepID=UPI001267AD48|nr:MULTISPECIES: hypothetical protein [unclassified Roseivivax]QFS83849.1 hypothetical protein FIV09_13520 [Roseivivax sp. THAF197b]QFT47681.1 hypothetical protein FIU97_13960 [Roseivivax sp. THAF40]